LNISIDELTSYTYCPQYLRLEGPSLLKSQSAFANEMRSLLTFVFRRELETGKKTSPTLIKDKWIKIFFTSFEEVESKIDRKAQNLFRKSQLSLKRFIDWYSHYPGRVLVLNFSLAGEVDGLYPHVLTGFLPVIFEHDDGRVALFFLEDLVHPEDILRSSAIKYPSSILNKQNFYINEVINFGSTGGSTFKIVQTYPDETFWMKTFVELKGLLDIIHTKVFYTNFSACSNCSIVERCRKSRI
jgi:hypothetical protein